MEEITNSEQELKITNSAIWDNAKRAKSLILVFWILIGLSILGVFSDYLELELLKSVQLGFFITDADANVNDLRQGIIGLLQTGLYITSVIVFLNWFRRAYGNLHRLRLKHLKHKESMAIWSWVVPFISLYQPVQIMNEIWTTTQEQIKKYDTSYVVKNGTMIIGLWWTLFIISNFIGRYILKTAFKQDTIEQLIEGSQAVMISDILQIPEALLVILIVTKISKTEVRLVKEVKRSGGNIEYRK